MYYVGVDLGGTKIHVALADEDGVILADDRRPTPHDSDGRAVTNALLDAIGASCEEAGIAPDRVSAAGIASIGRLDKTDGVIRNPANLPDAIDLIPLTDPISSYLGTDDVFLHNDTVAGVIGERFFSEESPTDMIYLTISTGIGAGVCVDGNVLSGWDGNAGEVGHMQVDPDGAMQCGCGRAGHWEAYCSGSNIPEYARHLYEQDPVDTAVPIDDPSFTAEDVFDLAGEDAFADRVVERVADWNALGLTNVANAFAPMAIYVGGGVALNNPELTLDPVRERLQDMVFVNTPELRLTQLGDEVVVKGAIASAMTDGTGDPRRAAD